MKKFDPDYPLQGTALDLPLKVVLTFSESERNRFILRLVNALGKKIDSNEMALKKKISMQNLNRIESMQRIGSMQLI